MQGTRGDEAVDTLLSQPSVLDSVYRRRLATEVTGTRSGSASNAILSEGLLILGWVAMWRPVEIFLYDWWPELGKRRVFARIGGMSIEARRATSVGNGELSESLTDLPTAQRLPQTA